MNAVVARALAIALPAYLVWSVLYPVVSDTMLWVVTGLAVAAFLGSGAYVWVATSDKTLQAPSAVRAAIERRKQR
jgi:hypothetical protein